MPTTLGIQISLTGTITISDASDTLTLVKGFEGFTVTNDPNLQIFADVPIGDAPNASQKRYVVVVEGGASGISNQDISTINPTIGGVLATTPIQQLSPSTSFKQYSAIHYAEVPTGTTATVDLPTLNQKRTAVKVYSVYIDVENTLSVFDTSAAQGTTTLTNTLDAPVGNSLAFGGAQYRNGEDTPSLSFTGTLGLETDYRADILSDENFYAGSFVRSAAGTGLTAITSDPTAAGAESVAVAATFALT